MNGTRPHRGPLPPTHGNGGSARSEAAYTHLKDRQFEGDLTAGAKNSVVEVARTLDRSRVPVMEALKRLESEGFVRLVPQVGCRVMTPVAAEVRDFFNLFAVVEATVRRLVALRTLKSFVEGNPAYTDAREPVLAWYQQALKANWASPAELKREIGNTSILKDGRAVFNIAGNKYRIVVWINYSYRIVYVRFIGTHEQYDRIDAQTI